MRGVFLDRDTMKPDDLDFSAFDAVIAQWDSYPWSQPHEVAQRIAPCDIGVVNKTLIGHTANRAFKDTWELIADRDELGEVRLFLIVHGWKRTADGTTELIEEAVQVYGPEEQ